MIDCSNHYFVPPTPYPGYSIEALKVRRILLANETLQKKTNSVVRIARKLPNVAIKSTALKDVLNADLLLIFDNLMDNKSSRVVRLARYQNKLPFLVSPEFNSLVASGWGWSTSLWLPVHLFHFHPHRYLKAKDKGVSIGIVGYKSLPSEINSKQVKVWLESFLGKFTETKGLIWDKMHPVGPAVYIDRKVPIYIEGKVKVKPKRKLKLKV